MAGAGDDGGQGGVEVGDDDGVSERSSASRRVSWWGLLLVDAEDEGLQGV